MCSATPVAIFVIVFWQVCEEYISKGYQKQTIGEKIYTKMGEIGRALLLAPPLLRRVDKLRGHEKSKCCVVLFSFSSSVNIYWAHISGKTQHLFKHVCQVLGKRCSGKCGTL